MSSLVFAAYGGSLADPSGSSALGAAVQWLQGVLLGTVATSIAVIAVAAVGFGLLAGRIEWRRGVTVLLGCFLLFGASSIVAGLRGMTDDGEPGTAAPAIAPPPPSVQQPALQPYDPYAGAAVIR